MKCVVAVCREILAVCKEEPIGTHLRLVTSGSTKVYIGMPKARIDIHGIKSIEL